MAKFPQTIMVDEATARRVLLARAIEDVDAKGRLLEPAERDRLEQAVLHEASDPLQPGRPEPARYLSLRAGRVLAAAVARNPRFAGLEDSGRWRGHIAWLLPLLAFISGVASERIGDPHKLDLLSPPLMVFMAWNLAVYGLLALSLLAQGPHRAPWASRIAAWLGALPLRMHEQTGMGLRVSVLARFRHHWWSTAGTLEAQRMQQVLHSSAAAWAVGIALSIAAGGIVREYRVGWESLWLDAGGVHSLLNVLFAPVLWLLPVPGFTLEELQRLHSDWGIPMGREQARKWVMLYLGLLVLVVVIPRTLLAGIAAWRARTLSRAVDLGLSDSYFADILARMNPTVAIGFIGVPTSLGELVLTSLRQAASDPGQVLRGQMDATLARTTGGDELRAVEATGAEEVDQVWLCVANAQELTAAVPLLQSIGRPVLILHASNTSERELAAIARQAAVPFDVLGIESAASSWAVEDRLWDAMVRRLHPSRQQRGLRLVSEVRQVQEARMHKSMRVLGEALARSARESQQVPGERSWKPTLPTAESREKGRAAREAVMAEVLLKVDQHIAGALHQLREFHGLAQTAPAGDEKFNASSGATAELLHPPNAAVAGAAAGIAAGAVAGAKIDLLTGGMTMGAGAALGALIGGTGAFGAARWLGDADVRLSDEQLTTLAGRMVVHYLAVIHACRLPPDAAASAPERWKSETQAELNPNSKTSDKVWSQARKLGEEDAAAEVARAVQLTTHKVLARLRPPG